MKNKLQKIKKFFNLAKKTTEAKHIAQLEQRLLDLEKANLMILTKLLQLENISSANKIANKNNIVLVAPKDCNAGKTPTYH